MKLYIAGTGHRKEGRDPDYETGVRNRLLSYAYRDAWGRFDFEFWIEKKPQRTSVFLDSGAFTAFTQKRTINLESYCEYVSQHRAALDAYAVLDVIGDEVATRRNLHKMRSFGLDPMPIYHADREPLSVLVEMIDEDGATQFAIGGLASAILTRDQVAARLDAVWNEVGRRVRAGAHLPRVHGLGVMAQWALERYPFYSADSSSAIVGAGMGRVMRFKDGRMRSGMWADDVRTTWDGAVADGVGRVNEHGKSNRRAISAHLGRRKRNIEAQLAMERYVTDLWAKRGVKWNEGGGDGEV